MARHPDRPHICPAPQATIIQPQSCVCVHTHTHTSHSRCQNRTCTHLSWPHATCRGYTGSSSPPFPQAHKEAGQRLRPHLPTPRCGTERKSPPPDAGPSPLLLPRQFHGPLGLNASRPPSRQLPGLQHKGLSTEGPDQLLGVGWREVGGNAQSLGEGLAGRDLLPSSL